MCIHSLHPHGHSRGALGLAPRPSSVNMIFDIITLRPSHAPRWNQRLWISVEFWGNTAATRGEVSSLVQISLWHVEILPRRLHHTPGQVQRIGRGCALQPAPSPIRSADWTETPPARSQVLTPLRVSVRATAHTCHSVRACPPVCAFGCVRRSHLAHRHSSPLNAAPGTRRAKSKRIDE